MDDRDTRIAELEARVASYGRARALCDAVDERLELALRRREPLERVVPDLLEIVCDHLGASAACVQTFDEALAERTFRHGGDDDGELDGATLDDAIEAGGAFRLAGGRHALAHALDVAGEDFGRAAVVFDGAPEADAAELLERFCEQLDNHLAAVAEARRRFEIIRSISDALKDPVLDRGIAQAIEILQRTVGFEDLILLFRHEDDLEAGAIRYAIYKRGVLAHDSDHHEDPEVDAFVRGRAAAFLDGQDGELRTRFGLQRYREEVLITGVRSARVVGRMLVTSRQGEFHTYDRELLDRFADYLRQRIVDFNREWKQLSVIFSRDVCERLLREEGYVERYLTPRERDVAILYADIAGFTRISEHVLKTPDAVGRLIGTWAEGVVRILWDTDGAFDKMVGDCVIGLWGPPFFERSDEDACARALDAAARIREFTRSLANHEALPELAGLEPPPDVAVGLNFCPLSVGLFGPNDDFTGFSSGMNNTARLQGVARAGEILCMEEVVRAIGSDERFGPPREAEVKNVSAPLRFRALS